MSHWADALVLLVTANVAAWAAGRLSPQRWRIPLDGRVSLPDGNRLLGEHKTWVGLLAGTLLCAVMAGLLHRPLLLGAAFGLLSLIGDCTSSFIKRRRRIEPGGEIPGLDQLPEALLPLLALWHPLGLRPLEGVLVAVIFLLLDVAVARIRHF
jgi:CDP-2,3-bis-(O-geranylgeranyl)-sn-glycerol synthase